MRSFCLIIFLSFLSLFNSAYADIERRASVDIGSGGTKLAIADVELETNQIVEILYEKSFSVPYQASLDQSVDRVFDEETKDLGLRTMVQIKEITDFYGVERIVAIATSAFRKAKNGQEFVKELEEASQISIRIISQMEEAEIAFFSAIAAGGYDPQETVVWDIGTGSFQIMALDDEGELVVHMGEDMGSVAFKSYIIENIQDHDLQEVASPNPISEEDLQEADAYARAFGRKAQKVIKEKIRSSSRKVVGIGRLFYNSIFPVASDGEVINRNGLRSFIDSSLNKTDAELNNPFAHVDVSNCVLTLAIMKALQIHEVIPIETTSTRGILVYPAYWN